MPPLASSNQTTEQRWIISAIARDLADMAAFTSAPELWSGLPAGAVRVQEVAGVAPGQAYLLTLQFPNGGEPVTTGLKITGTVWSPELYAPLVRTLLARRKPATPGTTTPAAADAGETLPETALLTALATPLTLEIERQNQRLSGWLQGHPLDAGAHEQAALLLGALALRENSGLFWDPRGLCNRAAAHLAFARALRAETAPASAESDAGAVAEILVGLIIDTKADCARRLAALRTRVAARPALAPWVMAATLRNTRDYRLLVQPQSATLLERLEWFRAMSEALGAEQAIKRLGPINQQPVLPDWSRMVLQVLYGVDSGHRFALPSVQSELAEAAQIFPGLPTQYNSPERFAATLNQLPGDAVQADEDQRARWRVIDWGTWAQFVQRHLLHAADETYDFLQDKWGVPDEANAFRRQIVPLLDGLTLYPLCLRNLGKDDGENLFPRAADLLNKHPDLVSDGAWYSVVTRAPRRLAANGSWPAVSRAWFSPGLPTGTPYGFYIRADADGVLPAAGLAELARLHEIAPLQYGVCRAYARALGAGRPVVEAFKEVLAPLLPYYLPALVAESELVRDDPARYGALMSQAAAQEPVYYCQLGRYYAEHKLDSQAAQAYQAAIDHNADEVTLSSSCAWLVNYYFDHGQKARAMVIAQRAAEAYSFGGLETLAHLLERMGQTAEAESYYAKLNERYNDSSPLRAFYARQAPAHPEYAGKMRAARDRLFPGGMKDLSLAQLAGKPTRGVLVNGENAISQGCGLKLGAIIVAIDGKRVDDFPQYVYVRELSDSPEVDLLVYQEGGYRAIHASVPDRRFNLDFRSWP